MYIYSNYNFYACFSCLIKQFYEYLALQIKALDYWYLIMKFNICWPKWKEFIIVSIDTLYKLTRYNIYLQERKKEKECMYDMIVYINKLN